MYVFSYSLPLLLFVSLPSSISTAKLHRSCLQRTAMDLSNSRMAEGLALVCFDSYGEGAGREHLVGDLVCIRARTLSSCCT